MATYSYYSRLTLVHPKDVNKLDPSLGRIIAETATTGKFILSEISWDGNVGPNKDTAVAYNTRGSLKIHEPLGVRLLDYIRFAALEVGINNHLSAMFLLEIEIVAETVPDNKDLRYIWPIMILATEVKGGVSERGTEYNIEFIHAAHHSQTDMVQPIKETLSVGGVSKVEEYFKNFAKELELLEFKYAEAGQKAGSMSGGGGDHPAASDPYHDEYHFILDPRIKNYTMTTKEGADPAVQGSWGGLGKLWGSYNISAKPGTTLTSQIQRVLASTKESSQLYLENYGSMPGAGKSASQSSDANKKSLKDAMGKIYNFFRIETYTVYKEFDYIRGRYAVRHIFIVYLALQPNLYQYPDELDELNKPANKDKVVQKLKAYVQEGLLRKVYYYMYTGLNTEILKFNIQLNQAYYLPSFPVVWAERGSTGPGAMLPHNFSRAISPYGRNSDDTKTRNAITQNENEARKLSGQIQTEKSSSKKKELQKQLEQRKAAITELNAQLNASGKQTTVNKNSVGNRAELLSSLSKLYIEDVDYQTGLTEAAKLTPGHRPRMEPDKLISQTDIKKEENEALMDKIFTVQLAARDLMELEMEVRADPYWLGQPNMILAGKKGIEKLELPPAVTQEINSYITPAIDPDYATRDNHWGSYNSAKIYKGGNLFYLNAQLPVNDFGQDDTMKLDQVDQIIGIYQVNKIKNEFKNGAWTQTINAIRDLTIPSQFIPRASIGETSFEDFMQQSISDPERALDNLNSKPKEEVKERDKTAENLSISKLTGTQGMGAAGLVPGTTSSTKPEINAAKNIYDKKLAANPPPTVTPPVEYAAQLVKEGKSKDQAYSEAKAKFNTEINNYYNHLEKLNKDSYKEAGVADYKPYSGTSLAGIVTKRSGSGGLEDWKANNKDRPGAWALNNPGGLGFDAKTGRYNQYDSFDNGIKSVNDYYNYGTGVPPNQRQGSDRYLLPKDNTKSETDFIMLKSKGPGKS